MRPSPKFAISAIATALALAGCSDPIVGQWEASKFPYAEAGGEMQTADLPYITSWDDGAQSCTSTYEVSFEMGAGAAQQGELSQRVTTLCSGGTTSGLKAITDTFAMDSTAIEAGASYAITLESFQDGADVALDCSLSDDQLTLTCDDGMFAYQFESAALSDPISSTLPGN